MVDFGDEFVIEGFRIPWFIWIQLLVLVCLVFLFFCASIFTSDLSKDDAASSSNSSRASRLEKPQVKRATGSRTVANRLQVGESQRIKVELPRGTSRSIVRGDDAREREHSSEAFILHPCSYFRLARLAFLKCLGFGPENPSSSEPRRES